VDSVESAIAAQEGGASRLELCSALSEGGLTPSAGMMKMVRSKVTIPIFVLIRPRAGDFSYSDFEFDIIKYDILETKQCGANGIVVGILTENGDVDVKRMSELVELALPLPVTFHRAFDMTRDPIQALDALIELRIPRVLTSGQERSAIEGLDLIKELLERAQDKIIVMPGAGINERNIKKFIEAGVKEFHLSARVAHESSMKFKNTRCFMGKELHQNEYLLSVVESEKVKSILSIVNQSR